MPRLWGLLAAVAAAAALGQVRDAAAQVVTAPPILGQGLEPARDYIEKTIKEQLIGSRIKTLEPDSFLSVKLSQCKNKMSCLAAVAVPAKASHVLHTILARRDNKVLAQFTLLDAVSAEPTETIRVTSGYSLGQIETAVAGAIEKMMDVLKKLPATCCLSAEAIAAAGGGTAGGSGLAAGGGAGAGGGGGGSNPSSGGSSASFSSGGGGVSSGSGSGNGGAAAPRADPSGGGSSRSVANGGADPADTDAPRSDPATPIQTTAPVQLGINYVAITIGGVGILTAAGGGVAFLLALSDLSKRDGVAQTDVPRRQELRESAIQKQTIGIGLLAGGAVLIGTGTILYLTGLGASSVEAAVTPTDGGAQAHFSFSW